MGLSVHEAAIMTDIIHRLEIDKNQVICLGEPKLYFTLNELKKVCNQQNFVFPKIQEPLEDKSISAKDFFKFLGFNSYKSLDYNDYENSEIIHNLNESYTDNKYLSSADLIYDSGTLEHVFNLPNALISIQKLLKVGGLVFHSNPTNGYLDHGFYQLSPTFYSDYYSANKLEIISISLLGGKILGKLKCQDYKFDIYRDASREKLIHQIGRSLVVVCAQKKVDSTAHVAPIQTFYSSMHTKTNSEYQYKLSYNFTIYNFPQYIKNIFRSIFW